LQKAGLRIRDVFPVSRIRTCPSRIRIFSIPDPGSGSCFFTHPGSRGRKGTGSRITDPGSPISDPDLQYWQGEKILSLALPDDEKKAVEPAPARAVEVNDMMSFLENMAPSKQPDQWPPARRSRSRSRSDSRERRQHKKKKKRSRTRSRSPEKRRRRSRSRSRGDDRKHSRRQRSRSRDKERDKRKLEELRKMADKMAQAEAPEQFR
jgi:hypothetical protein